MELIQGSETSVNYNLTPGKYPEENIQYSNHGESLKSRKQILVFIPPSTAITEKPIARNLLGIR